MQLNVMWSVIRACFNGDMFICKYKLQFLKTDDLNVR